MEAPIIFSSTVSMYNWVIYQNILKLVYTVQRFSSNILDTHNKEILHLFITKQLFMAFLNELIFCTKKSQKVQNVEWSFNCILYNMKDMGSHYLEQKFFYISQKTPPLRNYEILAYFISSTFLYEQILMKIYMNANILFTQICYLLFYWRRELLIFIIFQIVKCKLWFSVKSTSRT